MQTECNKECTNNALLEKSAKQEQTESNSSANRVQFESNSSATLENNAIRVQFECTNIAI